MWYLRILFPLQLLLLLIPPPEHVAMHVVLRTFAGGQDAVADGAS